MLKLSPREEIIHAILAGEPYEPRTTAYIGKALGISKQRVDQIEKRAMKKMRKIFYDHLTIECHFATIEVDGRFVKFLF